MLARRRRRAPADAHGLLGQGRGRGLRVRRHAARRLLPARQPGGPRSGGCSPTSCASTARCRAIAAGGARARRSREFVDDGGYSRWFIERLIVPQVSAVWSADPAALWSFPVRFLAEFFANHGMLGFRDRPRWQTVAGGSQRYVEALTRAVRRAHPPGHARDVDPRDDDGVTVRRGGAAERFDEVVLACHADQALALLDDPSTASASCSARSPTSATRRVSTPTRRCCRAGGRRGRRGTSTSSPEPRPSTTVTYYMNHLQRLDARRGLLRTLNMTERIDPAQDHRADQLRASRSTPRPASPRRRAGRDLGRAAHALLRRLLGLGLPRGRRRLGAAGVRGAGGR